MAPENGGFLSHNLQVIAAVVIFLACYAFIISEKINRSVIAMLGAFLLVAFGIVDLHAAYTEHINWPTIFLLLGMMILVGIANKSGIFQYIAIWTAKSANGDPVKILIRLALLTAVGSAFIDNVTTVLLIAPITIAIVQVLRISPIPFLITEILICNIGGAATLVGDPPNIMIGAAAGISFNDFLLHITPFIIVTTVITIFFLKFYYRKSLQVDAQYKLTLQEINPRDYIRDIVLAKKSIFVFGLTLVGFMTHQFFNLEPAVVAMGGATLLMLIGVKESDLEGIYHTVEWVTIFFFAGLFVLVGGLVDVGLIEKFATYIIDITGGSITLTSLAILWGAGIASAFVDNIPLVATMIPLIKDMGSQPELAAHLATLWWSLALGACLGGNGTLIASSCNLVVASIAVREGHPISFVEFLKISIPVTLLTLVWATLYVYIVFIKLGLA
ncbi:MAG: ArsB/NhaD family transporter [Planctomycetota bacterium]|nr:ArsB/NhaD family transporter [Planctomycetota bacterium]